MISYLSNLIFSHGLRCYVLESSTEIASCVGCHELQSCSITEKLVVSLHCSLNMLEGDTGYAYISICRVVAGDLSQLDFHTLV